MTMNMPVGVVFSPVLKGEIKVSDSLQVCLRGSRYRDICWDIGVCECHADAIPSGRLKIREK